MVEITIPVEKIAALNVIAPNDNKREVFNGIYFEVTTEAIFAAATDGRMLGVFRLDAQHQYLDDEPICAVIPKLFLKDVKPSSGKVHITLGSRILRKNSIGGEYESHARKFSIRYGLVRVEGETFDGEFPDWRMIVPKEVSGEAAQFDAKLIEKVAKMNRMLGCDSVTSGIVLIGHNGEKPALLSIADPGFIGVIAPVVGYVNLTKAPEWAVEKAA